MRNVSFLSSQMRKQSNFQSYCNSKFSDKKFTLIALLLLQSTFSTTVINKITIWQVQIIFSVAEKHQVGHRQSQWNLADMPSGSTPEMSAKFHSLSWTLSRQMANAMQVTSVARTFSRVRFISAFNLINFEIYLFSWPIPNQCTASISWRKIGNCNSYIN